MEMFIFVCFIAAGQYISLSDICLKRYMRGYNATTRIKAGNIIDL
jgi:hypothetical protein